MDEADAELLAALRFAGAPATAEDLPLLELVHRAYGPAIAALMSDAVARMPAEPDLDPARAPR